MIIYIMSELNNIGRSRSRLDIYINYISTYLGKARGRGQEVAAGGGLCLHEGHHAEGDGAARPEPPGGG